MASGIVRGARWLLSFFARQRVERRKSAHHDTLDVSIVRGRTVLDGATVNYSFGGLHEVFAEAFERLGVARRNVHSVLLLGLGAGSVVHLLRRDLGVRAPITALEIDPVMIQIAREHFALDQWTNLEVVEADASAWVTETTRRFELVVADLFDEADVPEECRTERFLQNLRERVTPGGLLLFNVVASRATARTEALEFAAFFQRILGSARILEVGGNLILAWERPRADSLVADADSRRYSPRRS